MKIDPGVAECHLSPVELMNVTANDGTKPYATMIKPLDVDTAKKYPVLISMYGGPDAQSVRNAWEESRFCGTR
ncbi:MAG TPA: hypothetical protein VMF66_02400 [Candidatus Acidoferrum sp.]|nr:hypothetical protein [Candidatus Acidoferrum sp.]